MENTPQENIIEELFQARYEKLDNIIIKKIHKEFLSVYKTKKLNFDSEKNKGCKEFKKEFSQQP